MYENSEHDIERNLRQGKRLLKYGLVIMDLVVLLVGGTLYYRAWLRGEEGTSVILSALFVLGGFLLFSLWLYWVGIRSARQFHE